MCYTYCFGKMEICASQIHPKFALVSHRKNTFTSETIFILCSPVITCEAEVIRDYLHSLNTMKIKTSKIKH